MPKLHNYKQSTNNAQSGKSQSSKRLPTTPILEIDDED
jgi:hypothetical protein